MVAIPCLQLRLRTLTPMWLGNIDRDSPSEKESGLIGSLRFWYEGILRSQGVHVCDDGRCEGSRICEACRLFGTTGHARRFRLEIDGLRPTPLFFRLSKTIAASSGNWLWKIFGENGEVIELPGRPQQYRFHLSALWNPDSFEITVHPRPEEGRSAMALLAFSVYTAAECGGLGAKTQNGFGQVRLLEAKSVNPQLDLRALIAAAKELIASMPRQAAPLPAGVFTVSRDRFFSDLFQVSSPPQRSDELAVNIGEPPPNFDFRYIPCAFDIRYKYQMDPSDGLRRAVVETLPNIEDEIFGYARGDEARASRLHVSHLFREGPTAPYRLKIWGDVPNKEQVCSAIREHITSRFTAKLLPRNDYQGY